MSEFLHWSANFILLVYWLWWLAWVTVMLAPAGWRLLPRRHRPSREERIRRLAAEIAALAAADDDDDDNDNHSQP